LEVVVRENAHVLPLKAWDEMGICPMAIVTMDMGVMIGGAYAAGWRASH
jgi:hypothetical protein